MRYSSIIFAVYLLLTGGVRVASSDSLDIVYIIDTTGSMAVRFHLLQNAFSSIHGDLVDAGHDVRYALVTYQLNGCALDQDLTTVTLFADPTGPFMSLAPSGLPPENLSRALRDCVPMVSYRPDKPRYLIWATDKDDQGTVEEREEAVAAVLGQVGGTAWALLDRPDTLSYPAIDSLLLATCSVDPATGGLRSYDIGSISLLDFGQDFLDTYTPWLCAEIFTDGFESGDTSAWSDSVP